MLNFKNYRLNLGLPKLFPEWKNFFSTQYLAADFSAGATLAFIAIPLSLAIALASGVSPATGLISAIIAGIICALFAGSTLSVSGAAAAMAVLIADIVEKFGDARVAGVARGVRQRLAQRLRQCIVDQDVGAGRGLGDSGKLLGVA